MADLAFEIPAMPVPAAGPTSTSQSAGDDAFSRKTAADLRAERAKTFLADGTVLTTIDRSLTALFIAQPADPVGYLIRYLTELQQQPESSPNAPNPPPMSEGSMSQSTSPTGAGAQQIASLDAHERKAKLDTVSDVAQGYARRHKLAFLMDELLAAILDERPKEVVNFMNWWLKQNKKSFLTRFPPSV